MNRVRFIIANTMKNLYRHRQRYLLFGVILFLLTLIFAVSAAVHNSPAASKQVSDFALRFAVVSGILLILMTDTAVRMTVAVRKREIAVTCVLGTSPGIGLTALGLELFVFCSGIWLTGSATGIGLAGILGYFCEVMKFICMIPLAAGILVLILAVRLLSAVWIMKRKTPSALLREEK